eukprot:gene28470-34367_t
MIDTALKCLELLKAIYELREQVADNIKQLADPFPKKTLAGFVKHCIFRNHYADEVKYLNAQLTECAIDLQVMQLDCLRVHSQEDHEDLRQFLSCSEDRVVQEIRVRNELAAEDHQQKEAVRWATEEDFAYLKADLQRCMEEISSGLMDQQLVPALQAEGERLMMLVDSQYADIMGVLQQVHAGQRAMHEDVRALCAKMEALQQVVQEATEDSSQRKQRAAPTSRLPRRRFCEDWTGGGELCAGRSFGKVFLGLLNGVSEVAVKRVALSEFEAEDCCHILLELMPFGSLSSLLRDKKNFKALPPSLLLAWGCDMADALCHIHSLKVKHRDLKAENCLVSLDLQLKLCDFGTAKRQETTLRNTSSSATVVGTLAFMASEVLARKGSDFSADVFSWAVVMVQILMRSAPTAHLVESALCRLPQTSSSAAVSTLRDLLHSCVYYDEKVLNSHRQRPSAAEVFRRMTQLLRESGGDPRSSHACTDSVVVEFVKTIRATAAGLWEKKQQKGRSSGDEVPGPPVETLRTGWSAGQLVGGAVNSSTKRTSAAVDRTRVRAAGAYLELHGAASLLRAWGALSGGGLPLSYLRGTDDVKEVAPSIPMFKARLLVDMMAQCGKSGVDMAALHQCKETLDESQETKLPQMPPVAANSASATSPGSANVAPVLLLLSFTGTSAALLVCAGAASSSVEGLAVHISLQQGHIDLERGLDVRRLPLNAGQQLQFGKALHFCKEAWHVLRWIALGTFLSAAQEGGRDVSELRGWLLDRDEAAIVHHEAAVQELGRRLRVEGDGAFVARYAACSEALQRRVLGVVDLLGQAL